MSERNLKRIVKRNPRSTGSLDIHFGAQGYPRRSCLALLWQISTIDWQNWIERSRYRGVNGEVA
jgi:hypothetical protein